MGDFRTASDALVLGDAAGSDGRKLEIVVHDHPVLNDRHTRILLDAPDQRPIRLSRVHLLARASVDRQCPDAHIL